MTKKESKNIENKLNNFEEQQDVAAQEIIDIKGALADLTIAQKDMDYKLNIVIIELKETLEKIKEKEQRDAKLIIEKMELFDRKITTLQKDKQMFRNIIIFIYFFLIIQLFLTIFF